MQFGNEINREKYFLWGCILLTCSLFMRCRFIFAVICILLGAVVSSCRFGDEDHRTEYSKKSFPNYAETEEASASIKSYPVDSSGVLDIAVDMAKIEDHVYVQDIIDSIRYVMLETTDECLIGNISELYVDGRFIFVVDNTIYESVFVFDENGRFLNKIGRLGRGRLPSIPALMGFLLIARRRRYKYMI